MLIERLQDLVQSTKHMELHIQVTKQDGNQYIETTFYQTERLQAILLTTIADIRDEMNKQEDRFRLQKER